MEYQSAALKSYTDLGATLTEPITCLKDIINKIRIDNEITIPLNYSSYDDLREKGKILDIDVRRDFFMQDLIREGKKSKFNVNKFVKVWPA